MGVRGRRLFMYFDSTSVLIALSDVSSSDDVPLTERERFNDFGRCFLRKELFAVSSELPMLIKE